MRKAAGAIATTPIKTVSVVDRAARVLECFSRSTPELSLPQISRLLELPKATTFRILANLVHQGLLDVNPATNTYVLGFATLRLADDLLGSIAIRAQILPAMQAIRDAVNESVVLSVRDGDYRYNIDSVESTHAIGQTQRIGAAIPLYAGAASRVLLAAQSDDDIRAYLARVDLIAFSPTTMTDSGRLWAELRRVRRRGYATSTAEFTRGGHAVASALLNSEGHALGALHVSIPSGRFSKPLEEKCAQELLAAARTLVAER